MGSNQTTKACLVSERASRPPLRTGLSSTSPPFSTSPQNINSKHAAISTPRACARTGRFAEGLEPTGVQLRAAFTMNRLYCAHPLLCSLSDLRDRPMLRHDFAHLSASLIFFLLYLTFCYSFYHFFKLRLTQHC